MVCLEASSRYVFFYFCFLISKTIFRTHCSVYSDFYFEVVVN